jgi:phospholipid/cholesterol/gamma-HCH transport system substrate-binding protein
VTSRSSGFLVGLFVIVGILLGIFALGYFGQWQRHLRTYTTFVTYFQESVDGLGIDAPVKYEGLDIGYIQDLQVARDPRYIQATLRVERPQLVTGNVHAEIASTGLTGSRFINIVPDRSGAGAVTLRPQLESKYPIIPSRPSQLASLMETAQLIAQQLQQADLPRTVEELNRAIQLAGDLLHSPRLQDTLVQLDQASRNLNATLASLNQAAGTGELQGALAQVHSLLADLTAQVQATNIPELTASAQEALEGFNRQATLVGTETYVTLEKLRQAGDSLNQLLERLSIRPSDLLYSQPPPARRGTR